MDRHPIADEIERRMRLLDKNAKQVSEEAGLGLTYVRDILEGRSRNPTSTRLEKIAAVLGCTEADLKAGLAEGAPTSDMPPVSQAGFPSYLPVATLDVRAGAGGGGIIDGAYLGAPRYFEEGFITRELRASPQDLCVVEVEGQSMEPLLRSGDTVLVDRRKQNVAMEGVFVLFDGDGVVCKWVQRVHGSEPPMLRLTSENSRFPPYDVEAERCQMLGRVVWFSRRL